MTDEYYWKVTLADDSVKDESIGDKWDIAWEQPDAVKFVELLPVNGTSKKFDCDLTKGEFTIDGKKEKPAGADTATNKQLFFRKRRQIRTNGQDILSSRTNYIIGFLSGQDEYSAEYQPGIGMVEEKIKNPEKKPKSNKN